MTPLRGLARDGVVDDHVDLLRSGQREAIWQPRATDLVLQVALARIR